MSTARPDTTKQRKDEAEMSEKLLEIKDLEVVTVSSSV